MDDILDSSCDETFEEAYSSEPHAAAANLEMAPISSDSSVSDVVKFLKVNGIPENFCRIFEENYIDGNEFIHLDENDVKTLVKPMGLVRKVLRLLPKEKGNCRTSLTHSSSLSSTPCSSSKVQSAVTTPSHSDSESSFVGFDANTVSPVGTTLIPVPDQWRPHVENCITKKAFDESARNEIVRTLVHLLFAKFKKPTRANCEEFARRLILKYPFMKDKLGNGYQSWSDKMIERVRNVIKRDNKRTKQAVDTNDGASAGPKLKRSKRTDLTRRYPVANNATSTALVDTMLDVSSLDEIKSAIRNELAKGKPRDLVLAPLMKSTYEERRMHILSEPQSVNEFLKKYPALSRPAMIEQEMGLVVGKPEIKTNFLVKWTTKYVPAILEYAMNSAKKNVCSILSSVKHEDAASKAVGALRILGECVDKKDSLMYMYEEYNESESIDGMCKKLPLRNQPRIAAYKMEAKTQYFIICEQTVLCEVPNFDMALFVAFSCYYCFNLEYPLKAKSLFTFFQDCILEQPESIKKPASYLATVSDIKRNLPQ